MEAYREGRTVNIYCDIVVPNRDRNDGKRLAMASAVLYTKKEGSTDTWKGYLESVT